MDKQKLRKRILTDWIAIDKLLFEGRKPNRFSKAYPKYIAAKGQLIKESYRMKRMLGQPKEVIYETYHQTPEKEASEMIKTSEEILVDIGRKNSMIAESLLLSQDTREIRQARLEALLLGECILNESVFTKKSKNVGFLIKKEVFEALVEAVTNLSYQC